MIDPGTAAGSGSTEELVIVDPVTIARVAAYSLPVIVPLLLWRASFRCSISDLAYSAAGRRTLRLSQSRLAAYSSSLMTPWARGPASRRAGIRDTGDHSPA